MADNPGQKTVIIVAGPTASGKTAAAIDIALHFHTQIISADSRQCYQELDIGVARPSPQELQQVPHHFIASHSVQEEVTAAGFETDALEKTAELFRQHDQVVIAGGTGLYIKAFCEGLDTIPDIPAAIRQAVIKNYEELGLEWLQQQVRQKDPGFFSVGEVQNPQRMMRALEVVEATGQSILSFRSGQKAKRGFSIRKTALDIPKEELHRRINDRVDRMMENGLLQEAERLLRYRHLNALQTVGYAELFDYFDGRTKLDEAIALIKQHTRQYAKRQLTWFRRDKEIRWFAPDQAEDMIAFAGSKEI
ncbi:MAG: tRNA (adenosine(37)-N6)-dimethylallyltransferase MiaA [Chitinophagaceae bacterium]